LDGTWNPHGNRFGETRESEDRVSESQARSGTTPWPLSAPESLVLLWGPETGDVQPLQIGLLELVARGYLDFVLAERRSLFGLIRQTWHAVRPCVAHPTLPEPLGLLVHATRGHGSAVPVQALADQVLRRQVKYVPRWSGGGFRPVLTGKGYVWQVILPALAERGHYARTSVPAGDMAPWWRWDITPAGLAALEAARDLVQDGQEHFAGWVTRDRDQAWDYLARAGSVALLVQNLLPDVRQLVAADPSGAAAAGFQALSIASSPATTDPVALPGLPLGAYLHDWPVGNLDQVSWLIARDIEAAWSDLRRRVQEALPGE
jgi:hypothetical protein